MTCRGGRFVVGGSLRALRSIILSRRQLHHDAGASRVSAGTFVDRLAPRHWTDRYGPHRQWLSSQRQQQQQQQRASDVGGVCAAGCVCRYLTQSCVHRHRSDRPSGIIAFTYLRRLPPPYLTDKCQLVSDTNHRLPSDTFTYVVKGKKR